MLACCLVLSASLLTVTVYDVTLVEVASPDPAVVELLEAHVSGAYTAAVRGALAGAVEPQAAIAMIVAIPAAHIIALGRCSLI
jgi:hypothetical protein